MSTDSFNQSIPSITRGPRESNFELLRIVAMFFVLVLHADFWSLGAPSNHDIITNPINAISRIFFESLAIGSVNTFILISGWFGIKFSFKSFANFIFQCLYFFIGIYLALYFSGYVDLSLAGVAQCFCLTPKNWFIKAYIGLYLLSPLIEAFLKSCTRRKIELFLILFYIFQTIWGCSGAAKFIEHGYSTFSFIGLYILARYIKIYRKDDVMRYGGGIYVVSISVIVIVYLLLELFLGKGSYVFDYINPLVVLSAVGLLLWFSTLRIDYVKIINWIAKSSFAVFLLHCNPNIGSSFYKCICIYIYENYNGFTCIMIFLIVLLIIFLIAVVLDQPHIWIWNRIIKLQGFKKYFDCDRSY